MIKLIKTSNQNYYRECKVMMVLSAKQADRSKMLQPSDNTMTYVVAAFQIVDLGEEEACERSQSSVVNDSWSLIYRLRARNGFEKTGKTARGKFIS